MDLIARNLKKRFLNKSIVRSLNNIALATMMLLLFVGCRANKSIISEPTKKNFAGNHSIVSLLEERSQKFQTLKIRKADIDITLNSVRNNVKGNIAIYRDSLIAVSILPALGYEAFRILCTEDSAIIINRLSKSYYASSLDKYRKKYNIPLGFEEILAMFSNEVFYYKANYYDRNYRSKFEEQNGKILYVIDALRNGNKVSSQKFMFDVEGPILEHVTIVDYEARTNISIDYKDFTVDETWAFPKTISLDLSDGNNTILMDIKYGQIVFNDSLNLEFAIPENYKVEDIN